MFSASCAICISLLSRSDDILSTLCGHVFHLACLTQWLERSKNCPSCRQKLSSTKLIRLYLTFNNDESIREDPAILNERIMNMQFQLDLKNIEIQKSVKSCQDMAKQRQWLKDEVKKCEGEITKQKSAIFAMKEQMQHFQEAAKEKGRIEGRCNALKKQLETYSGVEKLVTATADEVESMMRENKDVKQLCTYIAILQKQLTDDTVRRKQLRTLAKNVDEKCRRFEAENKELRQKLKSNAELELYIESLEKEIQKLKSTGNAGDANDSIKAIVDAYSNRAIVHSYPSPELTIKLPGNKVENTTPPSNDNENIVIQSRFKMTRVKDALQSKSISTSSILKKRPRLEYRSSSQLQESNARLVPDGLGGFTAVERYPVAKRSKVSSPAKKTVKQRIENIPKIRAFVDLT